MPNYVFRCPQGHRVEREMPADERNLQRFCPEHGDAMKRMPTVPLTVLWEGKFHSPWAQKKPDALGDRTW